MAKTMLKTISICLTKENLRQLNYLQAKLGENKNQVMMRALQQLYDKYDQPDK